MILAVVFVIFCLVAVVGWSLDRHDYNGGRCRKCETAWRYFDRDSQGGRGYVCERGHYCWVSWPFVGDKP